MAGSIDLYWIPLGAGGSGFVRLVGSLYEAVKASVDHRRHRHRQATVGPRMRSAESSPPSWSSRAEVAGGLRR
jgi:hypothetical protein